MRYKCLVSYDGTHFHGFQTQQELRTVQKEIEDVLFIIMKKPIVIHCSGRTDTGVHAIGQVIHFDCDIDMGNWNMQNAINSRISKDIYIRSVEKVDDRFHARVDAIK
ncbi:MAG: tRNA pseudouridine synthase A, partial [Bacilli bacterium]